MAVDKNTLLQLFGRIGYVPSVTDWQSLINLIPDASSSDIAQDAAKILVQNPEFARQLQPETVDNLDTPSSTTLPTSKAVVNRNIEIINDYDSKIATVSEQASTAIIDEAVPTTVPVDSTNKFVKYSVSRPGTYLNFLDASSNPIEIIATDPVNNVIGDLDKGLVELWGKNGVWAKNIVPISLGAYLNKNTNLINDLTEVVSAGSMALDGALGVHITPNGGFRGSAKDINDIAQSSLQKVTGITTLSANLADKSKITTGQFINSITPSGSTSWINIIIDVSEHQADKLTISGLANLGSGVVRAVHFNSINEKIGQDLGGGNAVTTQTIPVNSSDAIIAINIANIAGIGDDPTNNQYADSLMVNWGVVAMPYEAYGNISVAIDKVLGLQEKIDSTAIIKASNVVAPVQADINQILIDYDTYSNFDGTAFMTLGKSYILATDGDYIEFSARAKGGTDFKDWLGLFGTPDATKNIFGFYNSNTIWLRGDVSGETYIQFNGLSNFLNFRKIKLIVNAGKWELYINDALAGVQIKTSQLVISSVANCYTNLAKIDMEYFNIHTENTGDLVVSDPSIYSGQVNVKRKHVRKESNSTINYPVYVSFDPVGFEGRENLIFYVRRSKTNKYVGIYVQHEYDMSELVYKDIFRITGADDYEYLGGQMEMILNTTLYAGESEFVYKNLWQLLNDAGVVLEEKADHTGGVHGDEIHSYFALFIDGQPVKLDAAFSLIPCQEAFYTQISTMHETANIELSTGTVTPIPGHPVEATHYKKTTFGPAFGSNGYKTENSIEWAVLIDLYIYYIICCLGEIQANHYFSEDFIVRVANNSDNTVYLPNDARSCNFYSDINNIGAFVSGEMFIPSSEAPPIYNLFVWDRTAPDTKIYGKVTYKTTIGQKDKSNMTVAFSAN